MLRPLLRQSISTASRFTPTTKYKNINYIGPVTTGSIVLSTTFHRSLHDSYPRFSKMSSEKVETTPATLPAEETNPATAPKVAAAPGDAEEGGEGEGKQSKSAGKLHVSWSEAAS
jgi:hypothetical protein